MVELVPQTDLSTKIELSKKTTDELLDEIREQQIELIKRGLCPKCKVVTRPKKNTSSKRPRNQPLRSPSPLRRPVHNRLVYPPKEPAKAVKVEYPKRGTTQSAQSRKETLYQRQV